MNYLRVGLLALLLVCGVLSFSIVESDTDECRFAKKFKASDFLKDREVLDDFLRRFVRWEAKFIKQVGVDPGTGFTFDGIRVDVSSGEALPETLHSFTASSKQSIHLAVMAKVLEDAEFADEIYSVTEVFRLIEQKTETL